MDYASLSDKEEKIGEAIVGAAYSVHKALGPGLLEHVYEVCSCHELTKRGFSNRRQVSIPIIKRSAFSYQLSGYCWLNADC